MAYTSEIDKLEARWRENPKGRNFAPLADAYRKAGLIDNAVMLLETGLKLHPDYVSAHIVHARCLIDKKDDAGAQNVFKTVLALDGENIIALRGLADLAGKNGRHEEEVGWLTRLLNADPMNGDAAEALARARGKAGTPAPTDPTPTPVEVPQLETFDGTINLDSAAHAAAKAEGLEVQEEVELNAQQVEQVEVEGLARTQYEGSGMFKLDAPEPLPPPETDDVMPHVELPLILPDEAPQPPPAPRPPPPPAPPPVPSAEIPAAVALSDDDGAADTAALSRAEPVLTETMAELYLRQGHTQEALRVYEALLAQRPGDERLQGRVAELSGKRREAPRKKSGVSAQAFLKRLWSGEPTSEAGSGSGGGGQEEERPADQSTLAAAFDVAGDVPAAAPGEPTHPAHDHISLDSVFGDSTAAPAPAPADGGAPAPDAPADAEPGFSFDQFFGGAAGEAGGPRTPGASRPSGGSRAQRPPEDEADADQFQQWLKKLKS